jgi:hypothetical protein
LLWLYSIVLLVYSYVTGIFSSRKLERATYDSVACRYIAAGSHPDHDSLATFRRRFLDELSDLFLQVLEMAREMKRLRLGNLWLPRGQSDRRQWLLLLHREEHPGGRGGRHRSGDRGVCLAWNLKRMAKLRPQ